MAHLVTQSAYTRLTDRLNRFPQGAAPSKLLYDILKLLFSEKEAERVALLPIKPFTAAAAARAWKMNATSARKILEELAGRAILVDIEQDGEMLYCLPPPMAGFFEFSLMRTRGDIDQKLLSKLFYQYITVEDEFIKALFTTGQTQQGRVFVNETALFRENALQVLDYERASEVIRTAAYIGVSLCYCRHKMAHLGRDCDAPKEICMTFDTTAASLIRHGYARQVDASECMDLLQTACDYNLVQFGENVRQGVGFICNCCKCCCEAMIAARKFSILHPVHTTNFIPDLREDACIGCGKCEAVCPVEAIERIDDEAIRPGSLKHVRIDEDRCLGCGLCVRVCPAGAMRLKSREQRVITPLNTAHRVVVMAIERGTLQHLIFDHQAMASHRALATVLGVILNLSPVRRTLASRQIKSRYLEALISRLGT